MKNALLHAIKVLLWVKNAVLKVNHSSFYYLCYVLSHTVYHNGSSCGHAKSYAVLLILTNRQLKCYRFSYAWEQTTQWSLKRNYHFRRYMRQTSFLIHYIVFAPAWLSVVPCDPICVTKGLFRLRRRTNHSLPQGRSLSSNRPSNLFPELRGKTRLEEKYVNCWDYRLSGVAVEWLDL